MSKRILSVILAFVVLALVPTLSVSADSLTVNHINGGEQCGWTLMSSRLHRGQKALTYNFKYAADKTKYASVFTSGTSLWGSSISCTEGSASAAQLSIWSVSDSGKPYTAATRLTASTNSHITKAEMVINSAVFDGKSSAVKTRTIAHEIGHVFGLDDLKDSANDTKIMWYSASSSKNVTQSDLYGMKVVTHAHKSHSFASPVSYSSTYHRSTCNYCSGYIEERHTMVNGSCSECGRICTHPSCSYAYVNTSVHRCTCSMCGNVFNEAHILNSSSGECIKCGYDGPITAQIN